MPIKTCNEIVKQSATRMHSSSIRTTRFNGHLYEGVSASGGVCPGGCIPLDPVGTHPP